MTEHKRSSRNGDINNHIAEHHLQTNETESTRALLNTLPTAREYYQRVTLESCFTSLEQTSPNCCQQLPAPYAWFNSTCNHPPPGHTPGDLQFCSHLAVYSPPPGTQKETIPHPRDCSSTPNTLFCVQNRDYDIDFRTIAKPDILTRT